MADFKAPVFEPGGSMQQGMYTPKGKRVELMKMCKGETDNGMRCCVCVYMAQKFLE